LVNFFVIIISMETVETDKIIGFLAIDLEDLDHLKGSMEELLCRAESISKIPGDLAAGVSNMKTSFFVGVLFAVAAVVILVAVAIPIFRNRN